MYNRFLNNSSKKALSCIVQRPSARRTRPQTCNRCEVNFSKRIRITLQPAVDKGGKKIEPSILKSTTEQSIKQNGTDVMSGKVIVVIPTGTDEIDQRNIDFKSA